MEIYILNIVYNRLYALASPELEILAIIISFGK